MQILKKILCLVLCCIVFNGCSQKKPDSNTLTLDVGSEPASLDPVLADDSGSWRVINDLFMGLIDRDQQNNLIPGLASGWEISADGKTYTFHLRPGIKFSDGSPITADDFVFSFQRLLDPQTASSYNFLLKDVVNAGDIIQSKAPVKSLGVSAADNQTLTINLTHPSNAFLVYLTVPDAYVVSRAAVVKYGADWTSPQNMVSSGAYKLNEHVMNGYISASKNPYYYAANTVHISNIKYFPYTNPNTAIDAFKTGALDITWKSVPVDQYQKIKDEFEEEMHSSISERNDYLYFNLKNNKFAGNLKLRQALTMAIDRGILVNKVLNTGERPLYSIVTPTIEHARYADTKYSWAALDDVSRIKQAQELYRQAGYDKAHPLQLNLIYRNDDLHKKVALSIASMWQQVLGVNVQVQTQEFKVLLQNLRAGNYEVIASGGWGADYNLVDTYTALYVCGNSNNTSGYCNPKYDALIKQAALTVDPMAQTKLIKQAIELAGNDYPVAPLFEPSRNRLIKLRVDNYEYEVNYLDDVQSKWFSLKQKH